MTKGLGHWSNEKERRGLYPGTCLLFLGPSVDPVKWAHLAEGAQGSEIVYAENSRKTDTGDTGHVAIFAHD